MTDAVNFEAKLHALRRTQDGTVVSFLIHPSEVPTCIALDPLGQRYMIALAGINDDETVRKTPGVAPAHAGDTRGDAEGEGSHSPVAVFSPQAMRAKAAYATGTEGERARTRAAMLPKDIRFRDWCGAIDERMAENLIRGGCCDGNSRSLIASNPDYLRRFLAMETQYLADTNQMAEAR